MTDSRSKKLSQKKDKEEKRHISEEENEELDEERHASREENEELGEQQKIETTDDEEELEKPKSFIHSSPSIDKILSQKKSKEDDNSDSKKLHQKLKSKEKKEEVRITSEYSYEDKSSYSAALSLPSILEKENLKLKRMPDNELKFFHDQSKALLAISVDNIIEHAARRVDLFFYTLVAYYDTSIIPTGAHTDFQHGSGRNSEDAQKQKITAACHSSFFGGFLDESMEINKKEKFFRDGGKKSVSKKSILTGTHFMDSLNSTVELPVFVNYLDSRLEEKLRQPAIDILQKTAEKGGITPIEGLEEFLTLMKRVFDEFKDPKSEYSSTDKKTAPKEVRSQTLNLVCSGTLTSKCFNPYTHSTSASSSSSSSLSSSSSILSSSSSNSSSRLNVSDEYIELLLRLKKHEKEECKKSPKKRQEIYLRKIFAIQREIIENKGHFLLSPELKKAKKAYKKEVKKFEDAKKSLEKKEKNLEKARLAFFKPWSDDFSKEENDIALARQKMIDLSLNEKKSYSQVVKDSLKETPKQSPKAKKSLAYNSSFQPPLKKPTGGR